ncbi:MAG: glycosyltransferase [Candidatus Limnocylindrales bacterium]
MVGVAMFVLNDCRTDSRVLREAATLAAAGYRVTVLARTTQPYAAGAEREERDGFTIVRVPVARGPLRWALLARTPRAFAEAARRSLATAVRHPARLAALVGAGLVAVLLAPLLVLLAGGLGLLALIVGGLPPLRAVWQELQWRLQWRFAVRPWAAAAAQASPPAQIFHAHDLRALPAALGARERFGGRLIYDSHEIFVEAGANALRPARAKRGLRRLERDLAGQADALITVNDELAAVLAPALGLERVAVVHNCPARWDPPSPRPDLLRQAAGIPAAAPVVLYHGALAPGRGVEQLVAALREPELAVAHLAILGFGPSRSAVERLAADPAGGGRCHVLPPVTPDELPAWVASADVVAVPIQPTTLNHRLSTPNKLFEALAAGVPVVVSDFPPMHRIVLDDPAGPLGVACDPTSPADLGRAIAQLLEAPAEQREALRRRCLEAAHARWNWEREAGALLSLYAELEAPASGAASAPTGPDGAQAVPQSVTFVLPSSGEHDARTQSMAGGLAARGHRVTVIARSAAGVPDAELTVDGVRVVRVAAGAPIAPVDRAAGGIDRLAGEARRIAATARRAALQAQAAEAVDRGADLYHAMGFLGLPVALRLAGRSAAPLVYDARDIYAASNNIARLPRLLRALFLLRERRWARRAARVFTVNEACADYLAHSLRVERPAVVMNGQRPWTPPEPRPDLLRARLGLSPTDPVVLYHGGFMPDRGLPEVIAAMAQPGLGSAHLVLMGSGALEGELGRLAARPAAGGRVHLLPPVPPAELLAWVASAEVGVMLNQPRTLNERLSTPNKLFECLAAGTPVVSSDFPARRQIVIDDPDGPLGAVCDPTDSAAIACAIRAILDLDAAARDDLRARCLRAAGERYGWERQMTVLLIEYGRLTGRPW